MSATMKTDIEITQVSRHGVVMDFTEASGHRLHVRIFRHGAGMIAGEAAELPQDLAVSEVAGLLRECAGRVAGEPVGRCAGGSVTEIHAGEGARAPSVTAARSVLFFDVDGVLNNRVGSLDTDKLDLLADIWAETDCRLVCISSWRCAPEKWECLSRVFLQWGFCLDATPVLQTISPGGILTDDGREAEIIQWRVDHPEVQGGRYVILDDEAGHYSPRGGRLWLVQTAFESGLTAAIAQEVIRRLKGLRDADEGGGAPVKPHALGSGDPGEGGAA